MLVHVIIPGAYTADSDVVPYGQLYPRRIPSALYTPSYPFPEPVDSPCGATTYNPSGSILILSPAGDAGGTVWIL